MARIRIPRLVRAAGAAALSGLFAAAAHAGPENIAFPADYKTAFSYWMTSERFDNNQVRYLWANDLAFGAAAAQAELPDGSAFAMEVYAAKVDADGEPILDADGQMMPDTLVLIAAMEKRAGWGDEYPPEERNGDWEYAFFTPGGAPKPVENGSATCRACHLPYADEDFVIYREQLNAAAEAAAAE